MKYNSIIKMKRNLIVFIQEIIYQNIKDGAYAINLDDFKSKEVIG